MSKIDEKVVRNYRIRFWLRAMAVVAFFATVFALAVPAMPPFGWVIGYAIVVVLAILLTPKTNFQVSPEHVKLLKKWRRLIGESVRRFPISEVERRKLAFWAEHEVLRPRALRVSSEFDHRDKMEQKSTALGQRLQKAENDGSSCEPKDIRKFRKTVTKVRREREHADLVAVRAALLAASAWERYLATWDFLTKPEPDGIGVLSVSEFRDPDEYRRNVTRNVTAPEEHVTGAGGA